MINQSLLSNQIKKWIVDRKTAARKKGCFVDVDILDILDLYKEYNYNCAYCNKPADNPPDMIFPVANVPNIPKPPFVAANIVPVCNSCRTFRKGYDIIKLYRVGRITNTVMHNIITKAMSRHGGNIVRKYILDNYT